MNVTTEKLSKHFFSSLIDWAFRRRSLGLIVMRIGLACILATSIGPSILDVSVRILYELQLLEFQSVGLDVPPYVRVSSISTGCLLLVTGLLWEIIRYRRELALKARKRIIVIEVRGLRDAVGNALVNSIPKTYQGQRDPLFIDLTQRITDGEISDPVATLKELSSLPIAVKQKSQGLDRSDLTAVFGGLAPVPLIFLSGVLIDDEQAVSLFDWDRHTSRWRELDEPDDEKRFKYEEIENFPSHASEVALAVSVSYSVKEQDIRVKLSDNIPIISMSLEEGSVDSHWSETKQRALGSQFLNTLIYLESLDITKIHLFLAAPNSIAFRFGQLYDKRNLPTVIVYQYQRATRIKYPWGLLMPVNGRTEPKIV